MHTFFVMNKIGNVLDVPSGNPNRLRDFQDVFVCQRQVLVKTQFDDITAA